jgi:hypothetical protein
MGIGLPSPSGTDHRKDHVGLADSLINLLSKVDAERNAIDVHEDSVVAEMRAQPIIDPPGCAGRVLSPI